MPPTSNAHKHCQQDWPIGCQCVRLGRGAFVRSSVVFAQPQQAVVLKPCRRRQSITLVVGCCLRLRALRSDSIGMTPSLLSAACALGRAR